MTRSDTSSRSRFPAASRAMTGVIALTSMLWALAAPPPALAQSTDGLELAGALNCVAERAQQREATKVTCEFRQELTESAWYEGELTRSGLYLVDPGEINVVFNVLAPERSLDRTMLAGVYDTYSVHGYDYAAERQQTLTGGVNDLVLLELAAPSVNAVRPETRLVLRLRKEG